MIMSGWKGQLFNSTKAMLPRSFRSRCRELAEERVLRHPIRFVRSRNAELEVTLELVLASYQRTNPDTFFQQIGACPAAITFSGRVDSRLLLPTRRRCLMNMLPVEF
jgi:hypothetical protein